MLDLQRNVIQTRLGEHLINLSVCVAVVLALDMHGEDTPAGISGMSHGELQRVFARLGAVYPDHDETSAGSIRLTNYDDRTGGLAGNVLAYRAVHHALERAMRSRTEHSEVRMLTFTHEGLTRSIEYIGD